MFLEGVGVDDRAGVFYVSATNRSGTIYRGALGRPDKVMEVWQGPTAGDNGRGIDVDRHGRVYVAGGPSAEVRVFSREGELLAELPTGEAGSFLNDVWVGRDGSAYVTDSSLPRIWRVSNGPAGWSIELWRDVSDTITYTPSLADFDLGGIVETADGRYLLVAQGTTGQLWRIRLSTKAINEVELGATTLTNADGIVLRGHHLWVVQNFLRQITRAPARRRPLVGAVPSRRWRPRPTARSPRPSSSRGRLLVVDSKFGFPPDAAIATDRVVQLRTN